MNWKDEMKMIGLDWSRFEAQQRAGEGAETQTRGNEFASLGKGMCEKGMNEC